MANTPTVSERSIRLSGVAIPQALIRQVPIPGFDQASYSKARVLCIGAGGLISHVAPTLVRKGIGGMTILDDDIVEASNLNRQRYYAADLGRPKAIALTQNLQRECTYETKLSGYAMRLEEALETEIDLGTDVVLCGVDNNPTRILAASTFRARRIPVVFLAVSRGADHGYVFVQEPHAACFGCVFPDANDDHTYPCPGTPAIADILQVTGGLAGYAVDSLVAGRPRSWTYRAVHLGDPLWDAVRPVRSRQDCQVCAKR